MVSGLTVMISLAGLVFTGMDNFKGVTVGTIAVVGLAMIGSVTVLPALLALLGGWTPGRIPLLGRRRTAALDRGCGRRGRVVRRPLAWGGLALAVLVALAPALGMRLQDAGINGLTRSVPVGAACSASGGVPRRPCRPTW